jgi:hypothetical protein
LNSATSASLYGLDALRNHSAISSSEERGFYERVRWYPGKIQQPLVHRAGVDVLALRAAEHRPTFVQHAAQVDVAREFLSRATGRVAT